MSADTRASVSYPSQVNIIDLATHIRTPTALIGCKTPIASLTSPAAQQVFPVRACDGEVAPEVSNCSVIKGWKHHVASIRGRSIESSRKSLLAICFRVQK